MDTKRYYLYSGAFTWSSSPGSGQQGVTISKNSKSPESLYWQIQEAFNKTACETGKPIKCGETIRLLHISTKKRLHSHYATSILSRQQEISAFGETGDFGDQGGDSSDDWNVACGDQYWTHERDVRLRHVATGAYLR